ncbi:hypothetical protein [Cnuella takakiae]|uniref:hypothetical protein n=1 Tax=Cnuella takakiae TaxID=1302690 RepID=UPI00093373EB|nr:hypothetical protein [Cnuella takakiae]OLY93912.1 hypothetical protein BUE76_20030 [Cnuella takakiae]
MKPNLLQNISLLIGVVAMLLLAFAAYGSYTVIKANATANTCIKVSNGTNEMPWESMARQLVGAVSFQ